MVEEQAQDFSALFTEFNTILRDLEEKQDILKDRTLLIGRNLIQTKEESEGKFSEIRKDIESLRQDINSIKTAMETVSSQIQNFARKDELATLYRHAKIFDPLKFATIEDVEKIIKQKLVDTKKINMTLDSK
jgi:seryl-tRNA synthetase